MIASKFEVVTPGSAKDFSGVVTRSDPEERATDLLTAESVRMVAMGDLMFFRSHTLTVRSSLPDTTLSPTVKTADVTVLTRTGNRLQAED